MTRSHADKSQGAGASRARKVPVKRAAPRPPPEDHRVRTGAARREKTRQRLLASALAVVADKGAEAAQIDDYIAAAGVSRGTFYNHFTTTAELLGAVTAELSDSVLAAIEARVSRIDDPLKRLVCGCLLYMRLAVDYPAWGRFVLRIGPRRGRLVDVYLPRDLAKASERDQINVGSLRAAQDLLQGAMTVAIDTVLAQRAPREHLRDVLALALRGLGVTKSIALGLVDMPEDDVELPAVVQALRTR